MFDGLKCLRSGSCAARGAVLLCVTMSSVRKLSDAFVAALGLRIQADACLLNCLLETGLVSSNPEPPILSTRKLKTPKAMPVVVPHVAVSPWKYPCDMLLARAHATSPGRAL